MKTKTWVAVLAAACLALVAWVAAGPWLAINSIEKALQANDADALSEQVDFPALRASLKRQLADRVVRAAGAEVQASALGALGLGLATGATSMAVDATVHPLGLAALLEGRAVWRQVGNDVAPDDPDAPPAQPFDEASYRYESLSRFTATLQDEDGGDLVVVLSRQGMRWRLTDVRLPR